MLALRLSAIALFAMIMSPQAEAKTFFGVLTNPANTGPGGSCCSSVSEVAPNSAPVPTDGSCVGCTVITQAQYDTYSAAVAKPGMTRTSATDKINSGITLTCSTNPALSGVYAVNETVMSFLNTIIGYYVANGNTLPAAAQNLTVIDTSGDLHSFSNVTDLQNFYKAVGGYWLAVLNWKQRTIAGQTPAAPNATSSAC